MLARLAPSDQSGSSAEPKCVLCDDTGLVVMADKAARRCDCYLARVRTARLARIPARYASAILGQLEARPELHKGQLETIQEIQSAPFESYLLVGKPDCGKTHLMWALFRNAIDSGRHAVACTAIQLLEEYRRCFESKDFEAEVTIRGSHLRNATAPISVFIDDIDKARPSEYAAEQLFDVIDAAYSHGHQLVVVSNLDTGTMEKHFNREDERYGAAIVRRLASEDTNLVEMF